MKEVTQENALGRIAVDPKCGDELFHFGGRSAGFDLMSFWRWSVSDLVSNATRGRLAEFIVAQALGVKIPVRGEWDAFDLTTPNGTKVEVKSAAYVQSWHQKKLSSISYVCKPTLSWDAETNIQGKEARRWADVYVFALLHHQIKATIDPLDLKQWEFYVVSAAVLDARERSQHSISLKSLRSLATTVTYSELAEAVESSFRG